MTILDFSDREPAMTKASSKDATTFGAGNAAFYDRLQGSSKNKSAASKYGWVALPIAAVAIIGVVAATSTSHDPKVDTVGSPAQTASAAPVKPAMVAQNDAAAPAADKSLKIETAPAAKPAAAPAPVKMAKRAPVRSDNVTTAPAAASSATRQQMPAPAAEAPAIAAPAPVITPPAAPVEAPAPALSTPAPAEAAPAVEAAPAPAAAEPAPAAQ